MFLYAKAAPQKELWDMACGFRLPADKPPEAHNFDAWLQKELSAGELGEKPGP